MASIDLRVPAVDIYYVLLLAALYLLTHGLVMALGRLEAQP
ncbi:MAG TPA: hypothetical protein VMT50_07050 [Steroidobacteraceae bacterium]|nr:hypothetical protein [Steroidobacteraceae bacterium]